MTQLVVFLLALAVASASRTASLSLTALWLFAVSAYLILLELAAGRS